MAVAAAVGVPAPVAEPLPTPSPRLSRSYTPPAERDSAGALPSLMPPAKVDRRAIHTAALVIALGVVFQVVTYALGRAGTVSPTSAIKISLYGTCTFYLVVAAVVIAQAQKVAFRPIWTEGDPTQAALVGVGVGGGVALGGMLLTRLVAGHVVVDTRIALIVSERSITRILAAVLVTVVAAPLVEELLFRGLVVESMRSRGPKPAIVTGAILFSVWHLNPSLFWYYLAMGSLLGRLYWRRGLKSSIAAHASFNGCITVAAVFLALSSHTFSANGVSVAVPGGWHEVPAAATAARVPADLALAGPSGSGILILHQPIPPGVNVDLSRIAGALSTGTLPLAGATATSSVQEVHYPAGDGLRVAVAYRGQQGDLAIIRHGNALWTVVLYTGGSGTARGDFDGIVRHLQLPGDDLGNP